MLSDLLLLFIGAKFLYLLLIPWPNELASYHIEAIFLSHSHHSYKFEGDILEQFVGQAIVNLLFLTRLKSRESHLNLNIY
jgi:hypothetical protein